MFKNTTLIQKIKMIYFWCYYHIVGSDKFDIKLSDGREIRSTNIKKCADCDCNITKENDSGWEVFVSGGYTQSTCKKCDEIRNSDATEYLKEE